jgi:hypothetical protein
MIIDEKIIKDIYDLNLKLSGKDKIKLSKYQEYIPMYDIYSQQIYPIKKNNLHYRLIESHYRFINDEIHDWIKNKYNEYIDEYKINKKIKIKNIIQILKKNLDIIDNYELNILINTSYKTLYEFSMNLGLQISICKRKSFHPFIKHLKPYYSKNELIKLGSNMHLIDNDEIKLELLNDKNIHYNICKKISSNDISYDEIKYNTEDIIMNNIISWITFYSYFGSFLFNKTLRKGNYFNSFLYNGLQKIINLMKKSKELNSNYIVYRFIYSDEFLKDVNINSYFIDRGFISTTRDPFYSPGLDGDFGLILIKIHLPKNIKGIGLFIENFSLFPNEEEFLLPPYSKFKLLSKDDKFKYYHTNSQFEELINTKYELEYISTDYSNLSSYQIKNNIKVIDLKNYEPCGDTRLNIITNLIEKYNQINFELNNKTYEVHFMWFDGSIGSSYSKLYVNKINDGIIFSLYDNGYPYLNIEVGSELNINFLNLFYFYKDNKKEMDDELLEIILHFGRIFYFKEAKIYHTYRNYSEFINNYDLDSNIFLYNNFYNHTIYDYIKNNNKLFNNNEYIKYELGWYNLDKFLNKKLPKNLIKKYKFKYQNIKDNLIDIIENNFSIYNNFIEEINNTDLIKLPDKKINLLKNNYCTFNIYNKLIYEQKDFIFKYENLKYINEVNKGDAYKIIFKQPIRRY